MRDLRNVKCELKDLTTIYDDTIEAWSAVSKTKKTIPESNCLGPLILEKLLLNNPQRVVELNYDNGDEMTAVELRNNSITCAINLERIGVGKGDVVVFFTQLSTFTSSVVFGCYIIGAVVNPFETTLNEDDTEYVLQLLNPTVILYDKEYQNKVESAIERVTLSKLRHVLLFDQLSEDRKDVQNILLRKVSHVNTYEAPKLGDPQKTVAALLLTSGTTGKPKAINISHSLFWDGCGAWWSCHENSRIFIASSFRWVSQVSAMLQEICLDVTRVYTRQSPNAETCCNLIQKGKVTNFFTVPTVINEILDYAEKHDKHCLNTLENILAGGECFSSALLQKAARLIPNCSLNNGYGMTEIAGCITSNEFLDIDEKYAGQICPGLSIRICQDDLTPVAPNVNGQICIKSRNRYLGYLNNAKANKESFFGDNWFNTGDYGMINEKGHLRVFGRYKDMINCNGQLIIPSKIESALSNNSKITSVHVVGVPHEQPNNGQMVAVFIKLKADQERNEQLTQDILREMELNEVTADNIKGIFFRNSFPLTSCGKIDKHFLRNSVS